MAFIILQNLLAPKRQINAVMFHITEGLLKNDSMQTKNGMCFGKSHLPFRTSTFDQFLSITTKGEGT